MNTGFENLSFTQYFFIYCLQQTKRCAISRFIVFTLGTVLSILLSHLILPTPAKERRSCALGFSHTRIPFLLQVFSFSISGPSFWIMPTYLSGLSFRGPIPRRSALILSSHLAPASKIYHSRVYHNGKICRITYLIFPSIIKS